MFEIDPMEVLYQRRCSQLTFGAPDGLRELMTDISREVLRYQPINICAFIADYLDALMITRENARVAMKLVDELTESGQIIAELLRDTNITHEQANKMARIIQRTFKRHMIRMKEKPLEEKPLIDKLITKTKISFDEANEAAFVIQRAFRRYKIQKLTEQEEGYLNWKIAAKNTIAIFNQLQRPDAEKEQAATRIKAAYKGYYMRKLLKQLFEKSKIEEQDDVSQLSETQLKEETDAAIVIQKAYRLHLKAKEIAELDQAARTIQKKFRMFKKTKFKEDEKEEQAAKVIQKAFRGYISKTDTANE